MKDGSENAKQVSALFQSQPFAVLSTLQDDGHPYSSLVAFCASEDLKKNVFCTLKSTRKFANLKADGRIALLVDNRSNDETDILQATAVTVLGSCEEIKGEMRTKLAKRFLARHSAMVDFVMSPGCALMEINVCSYYLVTRFQNVIELNVEGGDSCG